MGTRGRCCGDGAAERSGMVSAARGLQGPTGTTANPSGSTKPSSRYRRRARSTEVDESLFGGPSLQPSQPHGPIVLLRDARSAPKSALGAQHRPDTIRLLSNDLIRSLVVPAEKPPPSLIIGLRDFQRIQESSRVLSKEQRAAQLAALKAQREADLEAMNERKAAAKRQALLQQSKQSDLEEEAKERAQHLLQRANRMRMEQEDEIKEFSELLLGVKCHMIRDTQILEKKQIAKEMEEEEKRLARMMEVERQKANEMQEELERRRKQELIQGRQELVKQIEKNAEERALRAEQKDQESQEVLRYLEQLKMDEQKELEQKKEQQKKIQAEIKRINDENQRCKEEQLQKERMEDERVLEYQRQKMEREAELEAEQERIRREKEKEMARLRAMQERALDQQAEKDALRAKRSQEAAEREWRRKEKEAARRKAEMEEQLRQGRSQQIAEREHCMAVQVMRDRHDFERILRAQQEQIEKEKAEEARRAALQLAHADDIRRQIQEQQQLRAQERMAAFEESRRLQEAAQQRSRRIAQLKQQKIQELRAAGIPEKYCAQVERWAQSGAQPHTEKKATAQEFRFMVKGGEKHVEWVNALILKNKLKVRTAYPSLRLIHAVRGYWLTNKVHIKRPSTGLLMYTLATRFCDEIHLYGFWPFPKDLHGKPVKYHYYDDLKYRYFSNASPHRMPLEFKTLYVLHNRGALKLTTGKCVQQ